MIDSIHRLESYDYDLPEEKIAFYPVEKRDESRLMICPERGKDFRTAKFKEISSWIRTGDLLVLNETRVVPARLYGEKTTGANVEVLLIEEVSENLWKALVNPGKRLKPEAVVVFENKVRAQVKDIDDEGLRYLQFDPELNMNGYLEKYGRTPLPPYIDREEQSDDRRRYQTVYAEKDGALAAPTAGLHFTGDLLETLRDTGVEIAKLNLQVGRGTFSPVREKDIRKHSMHREFYHIPPDTQRALRNAGRGKSRIFAVGTTTVRALESFALTEKASGYTDLFIYPPFTFKLTDCLITNFHLPRSSLIIMVSAFTGRERVLNLYKKAIEEDFRFYSYGDACLFL